MLNEVYAPKTAADLAWSRQKATALSTFIRSIREGVSGGPATQTPRVLLLYGPPGSGKLESLKVLLQEGVPPAASSSAASSKASTTSPHVTPTSLNVFHTCEATVSAYAQYLQHVFSLCSGQLVGSTLTLTSLASSSRPPFSSTSTASSVSTTHHLQNTTNSNSNANSALQHTVHHAHIIKFYGEPASHPLHRCTLLFLRQYEELRLQALREERQQRAAVHGGFTSDTSPTSLMNCLRRNLIFFIHTTHDSHNDKLDLGTTFPASLLQSTAVELFHCTPVTEINLKKRLKQILECEAQRRRDLHRANNAAPPTEMVDVDDLFDHASSKSAKGVRGCGGGGGGAAAAASTSAAKGRKGKAKSKTVAGPVERAPSFAEVLDQATLDTIVAGSQGDIRQALLQTQWAALVPPAKTEKATEKHAEQTCGASSNAASAADAIWARLQKRRALAQVSAREASATPFDENTSAKVTQDEKEAAAKNVAPLGNHKKEEDIDDVILISSSSASSVVSDMDSSPSLSAGLTNEPTPPHESNASTSNPTPATIACKRSRSPQQPRATTPLVTDMLSLLDSQMSDVHVAVAKTPATPATKKARKEPSAATSTSSAPERRTVLPTTRDEYLGLSHATGRLLTQLYPLDEVLDILNVPPRKMMDYLTNNQIRYFSESQLTTYAVCAAAASDADALRTTEGNGGFGSGGVSAAALRERRQLADRTTAGESVGNLARLLDVMTLQCYHRTYLAWQTAVHVTPGFVPQEPPPFLRAAYPRIRDAVTFHGGFTDGKRSAAFTQEASGCTEHEWVQRFLVRLESASAVSSSTFSGRRRGFNAASGSTSQGDAGSPAVWTPPIQMDEVDILREGLPDLLSRCGCTEAVVLDHYGLAPYIVLNFAPPAVQQQPAQKPLVELKTQRSTSETASATAWGVKQEPMLSFLGTAMQPRSAAASSSSAVAAAVVAAPPAAAPRRTVFKFAAASSSNSAAATPPPPPPPLSSLQVPHNERRRTACTLLQLKILQRGRDSARTTLRDDRFTVVATENTSTEGAMGEDGGVEERPWMPDGEDIEDD